jgi:3-oxoacyl-[acyl-carrier protein] reductase
MARGIAGKVAIVTGAGRGIGRAIAEVFAAEGARVLIADLDGAAARLAAEHLRARGREAASCAADVTRSDDVQRMAETAVQQFGRIDVLCANAGIYPENRLEEMTPEQWDAVLAVNLKGPFLSLRACLPQMKRQRSGRVVVTSSITGNRTVMPNMAHYAASKAGLNGLVRAAAYEVARYGITVNGVEPGMIDTEGLRTMGPEMYAQIARIVPLGMIGSVTDVANTMAFLASEEARYITGQTIVVDGGMTLSELQSMVAPVAKQAQA